MKVKIKQTFRDKENYSLVYAVGEEREFDKSRAQHLIALGLVEPIVDVKEEKKEPIVETQQEQAELFAEEENQGKNRKQNKQ